MKKQFNMRFKFLNNHHLNIPTRERFHEMIEERRREVESYTPEQYERFMQIHSDEMEIETFEPNQLSVDNRPSVFLRLERNRDTISENEWNYMIQLERRKLIEYMWEQGMIMQTIISEDENGFSLRTEINF